MNGYTMNKFVNLRKISRWCRRRTHKKLMFPKQSVKMSDTKPMHVNIMHTKHLTNKSSLCSNGFKIFPGNTSSSQSPVEIKTHHQGIRNQCKRRPSSWKTKVFSFPILSNTILHTVVCMHVCMYVSCFIWSTYTD